MKKALIITGVAFIIAVILLASANYLILGREKRERADQYKMKIDTVTNRHFDTQWIINRTVEEALEEKSENCTEAVEMIEENLGQALNDDLMNVGSVEFGLNSLSVGDQCPDGFTVDVDYTVESDDNSISKTEDFERYYSHP
ncbi:MAG: hypothetical protein ACOCTT_00275 [archaeon]